nr:reverse transcriptase domain-containing protein [Tanacetum cinerariifolium]
MHLKHHEKQIEDILNYLEELSFQRIEKMEERFVNGWIIIQRDFDELTTELEKVCSHISRLQKKHIGQKDKINFSLKDIQARHQSKSIAGIWLEKVVTPLIDPAIKGFAAASIVLKLERLKVDKARMPPKRTSTSVAPVMNQASIRQLIDDRVAAALEAQAANMANTDNTNRNPKQASLARNKCTEDCKVKFASGTLTEEALSWWNSFAQPITIEEAYKMNWVEFKKLLIKKYCPRTEVQKSDYEGE